MDLKKFQKKTASLSKQLEFLSSQGLIIDDVEQAKHVLSVVGYYRFSGYSLPFKLNHSDSTKNRGFKPDTTLNQIWQLYQFDRELRLLMLDAIEKIEVSLRASLSNLLCDDNDPFWYTNEDNFKNKPQHKQLIQKVSRINNDNHELFISHYFNKYSEPPYPPAWMVMEVLSFGACSKLFKNIQKVAFKKSVCEIFGLPPNVLDSWLRTLAYTRNICAHHSRLWNRWIVYTSVILKKEPYNSHLLKNNRRFVMLSFIAHRLLEKIAPKSKWRDNLFSLFEKYEPFINFPAMGFKSNWRDDAFWKL